MFRIQHIYKIFLAVVFLFIALVPLAAHANEQVTINFFYSKTCPHCAKEELFLDTLGQEYGSKLDIRRYEVSTSAENRKVFSEFIAKSGRQINGVPATFIEDEVVVGYSSDESTGKQIRAIVDKCVERCEGAVAPLTVNVPFFGEVDVSAYSLIGLTAVIAAIDGFNPCAMWVLLILIGMLLGMQNRRRMWMLGLTFIGASAAVYFVFLATWLEFFRFIGVVRFVQVLIGLFAVGVGAYYVRRFTKMKPGECDVTDPEQKRKIAERIKKIVREQALWIALPGIVGLAFVVNLIELACSAGLPAVYTHVLSLHDLSRFEYFAYLLLYVVIFMFDDMMVFVIAMVTMKAVGTSGKYSRYATLAGGVVIALMGLLLILKPEWLSFGA